MKKIFGLWNRNNPRIAIIMLMLCMSCMYTLAKTSTFDLVSTTNGLDFVDAKDDNYASKAYIVYDNGNNDFSILSETFNNAKLIKPTKCKYIKTDKDGYRVFKDEDLENTIFIKGNNLRIENEMLPLISPGTPYIFFYQIRIQK